MALTEQQEIATLVRENRFSFDANAVFSLRSSWQSLIKLFVPTP